MAGISPIGYNPNLSAVRQQAYYASRVSQAYSAAANPAQPEAPVEPVSPARSVKRDDSVRVPVSVQEPRIPGEEALNNAVDNLSRMRIQYEGRDNTAAQALAQFGANAY